MCDQPDERMKMPARLNPDASSSRKMLELYCLLLFSGRRYTLTALAERLQCSKTTIERLIAEIEVCDEVEFGKEGRERWFQIHRFSKNNKIQVMYEQIQQLSLCEGFSACLLPEILKDEIGKTVKHAASFIPDNSIKDLSLQPIASASAKGVIDYTPFHGIITTIMQVIPKKIVCDVVYKSLKSKQPRKFIVAPMRLLSYHNTMYVECWRFKENCNTEIMQPMTLAVQRIESLNPTKKKHKISDLPEGVNGNFGLINSETQTIVVRFDEEVARYISERKWSFDQNIVELPSGGIELTYTANGTEEAVAWILSFGNKAKVIEPLCIQKIIIDSLLTSLEEYQNPKKYSQNNK